METIEIRKMAVLAKVHQAQLQRVLEQSEQDPALHDWADTLAATCELAAELEEVLAYLAQTAPGVLWHVPIPSGR